MRASRVRLLGVSLAAVLMAATGVASLRAQRGGMFLGSHDDPAIKYSSAPVDNVVAALNRKLQSGEVHLTSQGRGGYLQSTLDALGVPVQSQMLVFSPTSFQARRINAGNPRALFFTESVAVGFVRGGDILELAAQDARQGVVFYKLEQAATGPVQFERSDACLACHLTRDTLGVPGLMTFSTVPPGNEKAYASATVPDHRSPLEERWGGWFVTGASASVHHMGNRVPALDGRQTAPLASAEGLFDADGYLSLKSDIAALLVFSHQTHMTNLITRIGWEARASDPTLHPPFVAAPGEDARIAAQMRDIANEVVDYLLFVDEVPLDHPVADGSPFVSVFSARGPHDAAGRSLHQLDLNRRLMRYPCSYLIDSAAFDALPTVAKDAIYRRMWQVLSGSETDPRYTAALSRADREAVVEILQATKKDLPAYFQPVTR